MTAAYTHAFFRGHRDGSLRSAREVVPVVIELLAPRSVVDVGCGVGTWLAAFGEHGVEDVLGIDGDYVDRDSLHVPRDRFLPRDLTRPLRLPRTFDLVVSLEVGEHLPPECAETFVDSLTRLGPAVLFSAAVPGQRGVDHRNEQWPDYWSRLFAARGYEAVDCIRPRVWGNDRVEVWYAQNTLLYATDTVLRARPALRREPRPAPEALPLVHPRFLAAATETARSELGARELIGRLPGALARSARRRLGRDRG